MMARLLASAALASSALIGWQPTVNAAPHRDTADSDPTYKVQLSHRPAEVNADGSVSVMGWLKCSPDLYTFEYSVAVEQTAATGSEFLSGADLPCDGDRHRFVISVSPYEGTFSRGAADLSIYIGLYDAANDSDLAAYDAVSTRLRG